MSTPVKKRPLSSILYELKRFGTLNNQDVDVVIEALEQICNQEPIGTDTMWHYLDREIRNKIGEYAVKFGKEPKRIIISFFKLKEFGDHPNFKEILSSGNTQKIIEIIQSTQMYGLDVIVLETNKEILEVG